MSCSKTSIPKDYRCPITFEIMNDPVDMPDGYTYDRDGIQNWLNEHNNNSPMDPKITMTMNDARPNINMKKMINSFLNQNKEDENIGEFQIFVKDLSDKVHVIWVSLDDSVETVKHKIFKMTNIPAVEQRLIYQQYQLNDNKVLRDYNVRKNTTINLLLRLHGGSTIFFLTK